jgi:GrpB-like predicted nucleotidyltransferase (UPF0157 family)/GNAT superfamily N-acetyltransferase
MYTIEKERISAALASHCIAIEHVGSTSVPGLKAKAKIDIACLVTVPFQHIPILESLGYTFCGEWNIPFKFGFTLRGDVDVNLHIYEKEHFEYDLAILFRDMLRENKALCDQYEKLKEDILDIEENHNVSSFGLRQYTLQKSHFIKDALKQKAPSTQRLTFTTHPDEWSFTKALRQRIFFDSMQKDDPFHWTFMHKDHYHFCLHRGMDIIGYAHVQKWPHHRFALRIIAIDKDYQFMGYGSFFLKNIEKWLLRQGAYALHIDSNEEVLPFYLKNHYDMMPFNDPDAYPWNPLNRAVGKILKES